MKILIFEGIATSGKSTVINQLEEAFSGLNVVVAEESETHEPIMDQRSDKHVGFFMELINRKLSTKPDLLIFDRLYLTQAFRARCAVDEYSKIEELLAKHSPLTVFLQVDESVIEERIAKSSEHRGSEYFKSRGDTLAEKAQYYVNQQKHQLRLLGQSSLPHKIINTTDHNYERVVREILTVVNEK